jgi:hypothetical protein
MADPVKAFIDGVRSVEPISRSSNRSLVIRQKITEAESSLLRDPATRHMIASFLQQAKRRAFEEIARHKRNNALTRTGEFFQDVHDELSTRTRLTIKEENDDTLRVEVDIGSPDEPLPHMVKSGFYSVVAAQQWIDSDLGNTLIKAIIEKYKK